MVERTDLPDELITQVSGVTLFAQELPRVSYCHYCHFCHFCHYCHFVCFIFEPGDGKELNRVESTGVNWTF